MDLGGEPKVCSSAIPVMVLLLAAIFISDTLTDLEIATAVFYIAVILLAVGRFQSRYVLGFAAICILLTLISFMLTKSGSREAGVINLSISLTISRTIAEAHGGAIWVDRMKPHGARFHIRLPAHGLTTACSDRPARFSMPSDPMRLAALCWTSGCPDRAAWNSTGKLRG